MAYPGLAYEAPPARPRVAALLALGTPAEVADYCKRLIDVVGKDGGFILAQGCTVPGNARFENVRTMVEIARIYGVYR